MSTFGQLLRRSRFAAYKPGTGQVFAASSPELANIGDFGLKYSVPKSMRQSAVQVEEFDTAYGFARMRADKSSVLKYEVAVENFSAVPQKTDALTETQRNPGFGVMPRHLEHLSDDEFQQVLQEARSKREEYRQELAKHPSKKHDMTFIPKWLGLSTDEIEYSEKHPCTLDYISQPNANSIKLEGYPTVKGRVLNQVKNGYAIGIGGFVCYLPNRAPHFILAAGFNARDRTRVHTFYLDQVRFDQDGRPHIVVSLSPMTKSNQSATSSESTTDGGAMEMRSLGDSNEQESDMNSLLSDILSSIKASPEKADASVKPKSSSTVSSKSQSDADFLDQLSDFLDSFDKSQPKKQ